MQDALRRLDDSFKRFFSGLAGYPHFKDQDHYTSFSYPQVDSVKRTFSKPGSIYLSKIGNVLLNIEKKLANVQLKLFRKKKGSHNRGKAKAKAKAKAAKVHAKIANQRRDFLHKTSTWVVKSCDIIVMEDLKIKNMIRNRRLAKGIQDAGWGKFGDYIEYKSLRHGKELIPADPRGTSQYCLCGAQVPQDLRRKPRATVNEAGSQRLRFRQEAPAS